MGIYGIAHELQQGGDVPVYADNSAEYWDAVDVDDFVNDEDDYLDGSGLKPEFKCDGCYRWLPVTDHEPHVYDDGHLVLCASCDEELD